MKCKEVLEVLMKAVLDLQELPVGLKGKARDVRSSKGKREHIEKGGKDGQAFSAGDILT